MNEIVININGRNIMNMHDLKAFFNDMKDGKHLLTRKDVRKRSLQQNAYYWSVMVPLVRKGLYDAGYDDVKTNDDAHEIMKHLHLKRTVVSKQTGDMIDISGHTSTLTIPEFNIFIEQVCMWAAEYLDVVIPSPNQELVLMAEYVEGLNSIIVEEAE